MYSFALTFQAFGKYAQSIPRIFLVIIGTAIYIALAIVGASSFESILDNMLVILSYWLAIYSTILIEEHYIFRKGSFRLGYDLEAYNTLSSLPYGFAAMLALGFGVMGAVFGMAQVWYVGILGRLIGDPSYGGDIGFELAAAFTAMYVSPCRALSRTLRSEAHPSLPPQCLPSSPLRRAQVHRSLEKELLKLGLVWGAFRLEARCRMRTLLGLLST